MSRLLLSGCGMVGRGCCWACLDVLVEVVLGEDDL